MKSLVAVGGLAAGLLLPLTQHSAAGAVGETCDGLLATIVGIPGGTTTGTEDADVIVSNGAAQVDALGGDDVICTTATPAGTGVTVYAGPGADVIDRRSDADPAAAGGISPDAGADLVLGGPGSDQVQLHDLDADVVSLGAGDDEVEVRSDVLTTDVRRDVVDLGAGDDLVEVVNDTTGVLLTVDGGDGQDAVHGYVVGDGDWVLDAARGLIRHEAVTVADISGLEEYGWFTLAHWRFVGSEADEVVTGRLGHLTRADLAGGHDVLDVSWFHRPPDLSARPVLDGGAGRDLLDLRDSLEKDGPLQLDWQRSTLRIGTQLKGRVSGFEDAELRGRAIQFVGNRRPNTVVAAGCLLQLRGLGGADRLTLEPYRSSYCPKRPQQAYGGPGDDRLLGSAHQDLLVGGPGHDVAEAGGGHDRCPGVEVRRGCESG